jgi:hypothetical protein
MFKGLLGFGKEAKTMTFQNMTKRELAKQIISQIPTENHVQ